MRGGEACQAVHQPLRGEIQRGADREDVDALALEQPLRTGSDVVERFANDDEIVSACLGDLEALALADEQLYAELCFQRLHLLADRALGDVKLLRRPSEALVASGGLERPESIEWWQLAWHRR